MNVDLMKQILMANTDYWVFARRVTHSDGKQHGPDEIFMASIPQSINKNTKYEDITLKQVEDLNIIRLDCNVFINVNYPPFQVGISFYEVWKGIPIKSHGKEFLRKALELQSDDIYDYECLAKRVDIDKL